MSTNTTPQAYSETLTEREFSEFLHHLECTLGSERITAAMAIKVTKRGDTLKVGKLTISLYNAKVGYIPSDSLDNRYCNPAWPCYQHCYARKMAEGYKRNSVGKSYHNNTDFLEEDREAYFLHLLRAMIWAVEHKAPAWRRHVDGEIPDMDYYERSMELGKALDGYLPFIFMSKRHDIVSAWNMENEPCETWKTRLSTWDGMETVNPCDLPESGYIPKGGNAEGKYICPNQIAENWHCTDCAKHGCGCLADKDLWFKHH